ncbi:zinc ribbon domain-containing protein [Priestia flexa]|uniref:DUF6574 domain-containing protein n=1 Tax=Priestia flexa TaxID=86664 RepID=UPI001EF68806|nr:DUF6574 domain-containing protein [Priestia flexa]MCG7313974.1 zinc ribbon domain-containing protein [Priestia flexa]
MQCLNCGHHNDGGKFCVKCGKKLEAVAAQQAAAGVEGVPTQQPAQQQPIPNYSQQQVPQQPNQHVENAKKISKLYIGYFMQGLKNPTATAQGVRGEQFINGLITMILFAISIPLTVFFGWNAIIEKTALIANEKFSGGFESHVIKLKVNDVIRPEFVDLFFTNALFCILWVGIIGGAVFVAIKLGKVNVTFQDVFARFGTFLIIPASLLIISVVLAILKIDLFLYVFALGVLGIFFAISLAIASFTKGQTSGMDGIYGTVIAFVVTLVLFILLSQSISDIIMPEVTDVLNRSFW